LNAGVCRTLAVQKNGVGSWLIGQNVAGACGDFIGKRASAICSLLNSVDFEAMRRKKLGSSVTWIVVWTVDGTPTPSEE
jgi:hypothetical protein